MDFKLKERFAALRNMDPRCLVGLHEYEKPKQDRVFRVDEEIELSCCRCDKKKKAKLSINGFFFDRFPFM